MSKRLLRLISSPWFRASVLFSIGGIAISGKTALADTRLKVFTPPAEVEAITADASYQVLAPAPTRAPQAVPRYLIADSTLNPFAPPANSGEITADASYQVLAPAPTRAPQAVPRYLIADSTLNPFAPPANSGEITADASYQVLAPAPTRAPQAVPRYLIADTPLELYSSTDTDQPSVALSGSSTYTAPSDSSNLVQIAPLDRILSPQPPLPDLQQERTPESTPTPVPIPPDVETSDTFLELIDEVISSALGGTTNRYPWIVPGSDNLSFAPQLFRPRKNEFYFDLDLRWSEENPVVNQATMGHFRHDNQFYWILDKNRVVLEVSGVQGGVVYQAQQTDIEITQTMTLTRGFNGYQAAWIIPNDLQNLLEKEDVNNFTIISVAGQLVNPEGIAAGPVQIDNSNLNLGSGNVITTTPSTQTIASTDINNASTAGINPNQLGTASTFSPKGGGSLFDNIPLENAPQILQGFPTTDMKPLSGLSLTKDTVIPKAVLEELGLSWGNVFTGEPPTNLNRPTTSFPGIKIAQGSKFDNRDLLNLLVNPFLSGPERDDAYLNSLLWVGLGVREPQFATFQTNKTETDWYWAYFSVPHNRAIIQYAEDKKEATYYNLYSGPGGALSLSFDNGQVNKAQSINATLGMLLGLVFEAVDLEILDDSLDEAKDKREQKQNFAELQTAASPDERKAINRRLNTNLAYANIGSSLKQVSGYITLPSVVSPTDSSLFQIKTGNIQRAVQFVQTDIGEWQEGDTFISGASRLSNRSFGPLTFLENFLPVNSPSNTANNNPNNESSAAQVTLISPEGQRFVQNFDSNSLALTATPSPIKTFDLAFDRLILQRIDKRIIDNKYYNGYLFLPTVEVVYAGTSDDFNYTLNSGVWFNVDNQSAGTISRNDFGVYEPWAGIYFNAVLSANRQDLEISEDNRIIAINNHIPFLRFNWNSASNSNNPWQASLAYTFSRQTQDYGFSITSSLGVIPQYSNGPVIGLFNWKVGMGFGLSSTANVEIGDQVYYDVNILQSIFSNISIGPYLSNYTDINLGFNSRILGTNYGGVVQYQVPESSVTFSGKFGTGANGFEASVKGGVRF